MKRGNRNPETPAEWQEVVDLAEGALALDSARSYGLVRGGPDVNVDRCVALLREGARRGYNPSVDAIERFALAFGCPDEQQPLQAALSGAKRVQ